ncbi:MAG: helix-turn-helix domain-containing protein [Promethearchaeota archaeon]
MSNDSNLTKNEERVLLGMVKYPNKSDKFLARYLYMKDSTVNYCRNQLEKQNMFQVVYLPILNRLGFELLCINFAEYNLKKTLKERKSAIAEDIEIADDIFLRIGDPEKEFSISFNKNYSEFFNNSQIRLKKMGELGILRKNPENIIFPINYSVIHNYFDYSGLLQQSFSIKNNDLTIQTRELDQQQSLKAAKNPSFFSNHKLVNLTEKEKAVFVALIDFPNHSIKEIAELTQISLNRNTVSKMRQKFLNDGLMRKIIIPNLDKIGFKFLVYYHFRFRPDKPATNEIIQNLNSPATILFFYNQFEAVILCAFKNYSDYKSDKVKKYSFLNSHEILGKSPEPRKYLFSNLEYIREFDFRLLSRNI